MACDQHINELVLLSHHVAPFQEYVQGAGGNTSIKVDDVTMFIKSSGSNLSDVSADNGWCAVDYQKVSDYVATQHPSNDGYNQFVKACKTGYNGNPSIETGFHSYLQTYVLHTHSVYCNLLNCSVEGPSIIAKMFPEALVVNYETPGIDLTKRISECLAQKYSQIIFLENHGVIVHGNDLADVMALHDKLNADIKAAFIFPRFDKVEPLELDVVKGNILFPDQVVFTLSGQSLLATKAAQETLKAHSFIYQSIANNNLTLKTIPFEKASILLQMESEKYRQQKAV